MSEERPKMKDFTLRKNGKGWRLFLGDRLIMELDAHQGRAAMLGQYDPAALARGELQQAGEKSKAATANA